MTDKPILFVAGLGRCGTTMTMQMLAAAGVPCAGTAPAYEDIPVWYGKGFDEDWLKQQGGKAVKWIDPTQISVRRTNDAAIFLSRDPEQQARSQLKMTGQRADRNTRRILKRSIERDTRRALALLRHQFGEHFVLHLHYDKVLRSPLLAVHQIAFLCDTLGLPFGSVTAAAAVIHERDPASPHVLTCTARAPRALTWLATARGLPRSTKAFGAWFVSAAQAAGIKDGKTAHGVRKLLAVTMAERGATPDQRMAILGHDSTSQTLHYSAAADARAIISGTGFSNSVQKLENGG